MWFVYALLGAVGKSYSGFFRKKIAKRISGFMYIWTSLTIILVIMTPFMIPLRSSIFSSLTDFSLIVFGAALSSVIGTYLNLEALKREDLSYVAPLGAFVPVFTLVIAVIFLGEAPPKYGLIGLLIVVVGSYVLSIQPGKVGWSDPLRRLFISRGAQLSLVVSLCYAINSVFMKVLTNNDFNAFVVLYVTTLVGWVLLLHVPFAHRHEFKQISKGDRLNIFGGGVSAFAGSFFHILALANTFTSYATAVRRLDSVISVLLGWRFLKERSIRVKLVGSIVMTVGAVIMLVA